MRRVLVTGANGFVGQALCQRLVHDRWSVRAAVRKSLLEIPLTKGIEVISVGEIGDSTDWSFALEGIDVIVHLAARVHMMHDTERDPLYAYRLVNTAGTERLAQMAAAAGVRRFVYVSTVKVNGERTFWKPFREDDPPHPEDPYAFSKWEAEQALHRIASGTGMEVVVVRPPLVYGPGVRANFFSLMRSVARGIPLPLGALKKQRSFIYVGNLIDALMTCLEHPCASGETFLVSDNDDVSTAELIRRIAYALHKRPHLLPVPPALLLFFGMILGKRAAVERLLDSLRIDTSKIRTLLSWSPPYTMQEGLRATAKWYVDQKIF